MRDISSTQRKIRICHLMTSNCMDIRSVGDTLHPSHIGDDHTMRTVHEIREENLRYIIQMKYGGVPNRMATATGIPQMQIARTFLKTKNKRNIGEVLARRIEERCGLDHGWMDQDHAIIDDISNKMSALPLNKRKAIEAIIDAMLSDTAQQGGEEDSAVSGAVED